MLIHRPIAVIDMGTNSFHMIIAKKEKGNIIILDREKSVVRLGEDGSDYDYLTPEAQERAIRVLKAFKEIAKKYKAIIQAVATSSVREARNQEEFINKVYKETKIKIKVLPGQEEARLIYEGVSQILPLQNKKSLVIDIGGGSTEIILGYNSQPLLIRSYKIGAVRLTERFFKNGVVRKESLKEAEKFVDNFIYQCYLEVLKENLSYDFVAASSGTVRTILELVNLYVRDNNINEFTKEEFIKIYELLIQHETPEKRKKKLNLDSKRADIIVGGALILKRIIEIFNINKIFYSSFALREGVIYSLLNRKQKKKELNEVRKRSVISLLKKFSMEPPYLTAHYALKIFDLLSKKYSEFIKFRELLYYGALMHNVGMTIGYSSHHKHSYYIITNTDLLLGFVRKEIHLIACIARYHRKGFPSEKHTEFQLLNTFEKRLITFLSGILRIAIGLTRVNTNFELKLKENHYHLIFLLEPREKNKEAFDLIIEMADIRKDLLEDFLNKKIVFQY